MTDLDKIAEETVKTILRSSTTLSITNSAFLGNLSSIVYRFGAGSKPSFKVKIILEASINLGLDPKILDPVLEKHGSEFVALVAKKLAEQGHVHIDVFYNEEARELRWFRKQ